MFKRLFGERFPWLSLGRPWLPWGGREKVSGGTDDRSLSYASRGVERLRMYAAYINSSSMANNLRDDAYCARADINRAERSDSELFFMCLPWAPSAMAHVEHLSRLTMRGSTKNVCGASSAEKS